MDKYNPGASVGHQQFGCGHQIFKSGKGTPKLPVLVAEMLPQRSKSPQRAPKMATQNGVWWVGYNTSASSRAAGHCQ